MSYIGKDLVYGVFEKQLLVITGSNTYALNWQVGSSTSLLVVTGGQVLEPIQDFNVILDGKTINFTVAPTLRTYIVYLGRELEVARPIGIRPVLNQFIATAGQTDFIVSIGPSETIAVDSNGIIVFVDGVQKIYDLDYTIAGNIVSFLLPGLTLGQRVDIYIHGVERFDVPGVFTWTDYIPTISSFNGMGVSNLEIFKAAYLKTADSVKLKLDFSITLTGTPSNVVRYTLPAIGDVADECVPATVNINFHDSNILETGVQTWASVGAFDIERQHGINYILSTDVRFKIRAEYDIIV
jgi:hypothetical protein